MPPKHKKGKDNMEILEDLPDYIQAQSTIVDNLKSLTDSIEKMNYSIDSLHAEVKDIRSELKVISELKQSLKHKVTSVLLRKPSLI